MNLSSLIKSIFIDENTKQSIAFLQQMYLFKNLTSSEISKVFKIMYRKVYDADEVVFEEGKRGKAIFFIVSGRVAVMRKQSDGTEKQIAVFSRGESFGELALIEEIPRSATARTLEQTDIYLIYKSNFDGLLHIAPRLGLKVILNLVHVLSARLRGVDVASVNFFSEESSH